MKAADFVKYYNGPNKEGHRIIDALTDRIKTEYSDEKIFEHKDTKATLDVNSLDEISDGVNYQVRFTFETYKENTEYIWNVNIETGEIDASNSDAKKITDIVDYYD